MPTSLDREPPVPSSALPRVRQRLSRAAERAMFALAMTLLSPACQDPQYGDLSNPSEGNSGGADSSTARTSPRDAAAAGKPDSRASATGTDGGNRSGDDRGPTGRESVTQSDASDDNKPPIEESADAGGPVVSAVPKWAKPLTGRYATRSFAFKQDQYGTVVRAEQLGIVEFALEGTGMVLRSKTCVSLADNSTAQLRLIDPASLPERVEQVVFSELERSWSTVGSTYLVGFMRQPTPSCEGKQGQSVAKAEAQVWLTGSTCRCVLAAEKPTRDDCRVLDPDHDKKPGVSYMLKGFTSTLLDGTLYGAVESDTHYVGGKVGAQGTAPTASISAADRNYQFGCDTSSCFEIADLGTPCPIALSKVVFSLLDEATTTTCADVAANVNALFPDPVPKLPDTCL